MSYYSGTPKTFVDCPKPYYWWECGALFGAMVDYSHYTKDTTYDKLTATALLAQVGPDFNYMLPAHFGDEGNDDLAFWGFAVLAAAETNFPQPNPAIPSWIDLAANIWNSLASRWNTATCGGGLLWQIFASNPNGLHYKNTISNGGLLQLSARLYRATGNQTYQQWAEKVWDWTLAVGLIDSNWQVLDGADTDNNCTTPNPLTFSYTVGAYLYGAAVMANTTNDTTWADRASNLAEGSKTFFSPFDNATDIMYEHACEQVDRCNADQLSFKGYLSRFMYKSLVMLPSLAATLTPLLHASAQAAALSCVGDPHGTTCGAKWYVGGYDGNTGLGQEMCALETIQGLLASEVTPPLRGADIQTVRNFSSGPPSG